MILSESEARERWCPQTGALSAMLMQLSARPGLTGQTMVVQADGRQTAASKCLGRQCMAWRAWGHGERGYCGLVGTPVYQPSGQLPTQETTT